MKKLSMVQVLALRSRLRGAIYSGFSERLKRGIKVPYEERHEEHTLITDAGNPRFEAQLEGANPEVWKPRPRDIA